MSAVDDLYRDILLDYYRSPRNRGKVENPDLSAEGVNPLCGDEIEITARFEGERIAEIKMNARGCSISQAASSMMTEALEGRSLGEAERVADRFKQAMLSGDKGSPWPEELEDMEALSGVRQFPVRIKCALLAWNTFLEGLASCRQPQAEGKKAESGRAPGGS